MGCSLRLVHQPIHNLDCALKLGLVPFVGLDEALATATALRPTIAPLHSFTLPCNTSIEAIDIFAPRREFYREFLEYSLKLVYGRFIIGATCNGE